MNLVIAYEQRSLELKAVIKERDRLAAENTEYRQLLEQASVSLGLFVSDLGWSQHDMDVMDSIDAALAKVKENDYEPKGWRT